MDKWTDNYSYIKNKERKINSNRDILSRKRRKLESEQFYKEQQNTLNGTNKNIYIILGGDYNARIGNIPIPGIMERFGKTT